MKIGDGSENRELEERLWNCCNYYKILGLYSIVGET